MDTWERQGRCFPARIAVSAQRCARSVSPLETGFHNLANSLIEKEVSKTREENCTGTPWGGTNDVSQNNSSR